MTTSVDLFVASMRAFHLERAAVSDGEGEPIGTIQRVMYETHTILFGLYDLLMGGDVERDELSNVRETVNGFYKEAQHDWYEEHDQHALISADIYAAASAQITAFLDR